ncbi:ACOX1-like protein [Mya arenaria]|uniref:Acyl-coenzyme A oxidase n=1 Tax=Mya arenaria TaxID=6604 RepID=A0ABY7FVN6_MYAAR|nr:ACOX1-like protein [Mya arenaria]
MAARLTAEFLDNWKNEVNPDLQKERETCTFKIEELIHVLDGGKENTIKRKNLENIFFTSYVDLFSFKRRPFMSKSEQYESSVAKSVKVFELRREYNWSEEDFDLINRILNYDFALSLHHTMFIPGIERLATDEQKAKWLPLAQSYQIVGTYAQTELGHGTNLLGLETTATYDRERDEFMINTPRLSSMKWWPGGLGKSCTHAIVLAQLVIDSQNHGMHPFMVQLRSLDDHTPMPGLKLGDIGTKLAANNIDNGFLILNNVRVPRENMLMKNARVTRDGKFIQLSGNKANYATMVLVRVKIISWTKDTLRQAATVSVRYSAVRRQTTLKPGTPEQQVLDFQTQQMKVFPCLAAAYALHAQSAGLKAFLTDMSTGMVETCRRSCGGHGYLQVSGVAENMVSSLALVTIEGENTVLYLQTARYLMKQMANAVSGTKTRGSTAYMNRDLSSYTCPIDSQSDCRNLNKLRELYMQRAHRVVMGVAQRLQMDMESGQPQEAVFNNNMVALTRAAKAHLHLSTIDWYIARVDNLVATCSPALGQVMAELCTFFVLWGIVQEAGDFLESETLGLNQPNAVSLVDAFDMHDETVASALGMFDGNVYQHLYESTKYEPNNRTEVHPSYYKHLRGLLKGGQQSKL